MCRFQREYGLPRVINGDSSGGRRDYDRSGVRQGSDGHRSGVTSPQSSAERNLADRRVKVGSSGFNDAAGSDHKRSVHGSKFTEGLNKIRIVDAALLLGVPLQRIQNELPRVRSDLRCLSKNKYCPVGL